MTGFSGRNTICLGAAAVEFDHLAGGYANTVLQALRSTRPGGWYNC